MLPLVALGACTSCKPWGWWSVSGRGCGNTAGKADAVAARMAAVWMSFILDGPCEVVKNAVLR